MPPSSHTGRQWRRGAIRPTTERVHSQSHSPSAPLTQPSFIRSTSERSFTRLRSHEARGKSGEWRVESEEEEVVEDEHTTQHINTLLMLMMCSLCPPAITFLMCVACLPPAVMTRGQHGHFPLAAFYGKMRAYVGVVMLTLSHSSTKMDSFTSTVIKSTCEVCKTWMII